MLELIELIAVPLLAIDDFRNGFIPAVCKALHDEALVDGTIPENRPMCAFNAAAMPVEPPAMEDVEAFRLGGREPKIPTKGGIGCALLQLLVLLMMNCGLKTTMKNTYL